MSAGSLEGALRLQKFILFAVITLAVVIFGYTLADDMFFAALAFGGNWKIYDKASIKTSFPSFLLKIKSLGAKFT